MCNSSGVRVLQNPLEAMLLLWGWGVHRSGLGQAACPQQQGEEHREPGEVPARHQRRTAAGRGGRNTLLSSSPPLFTSPSLLHSPFLATPPPLFSSPLHLPSSPLSSTYSSYPHLNYMIYFIKLVLLANSVKMVDKLIVGNKALRS